MGEHNRWKEGKDKGNKGDELGRYIGTHFKISLQLGKRKKDLIEKIGIKEEFKRKMAVYTCSGKQVYEKAPEKETGVLLENNGQPRGGRKGEVMGHDKKLGRPPTIYQHSLLVLPKPEGEKIGKWGAALLAKNESDVKK